MKNTIMDAQKKIEKTINLKLNRIKSTVYKTENNQKGYVLCISKAYVQGDRQKYWFGYRRNPLELIENCTEKYIAYCCKNANEVLCIPVSSLEENLPKLNYSKKDGEISHWHIVFFRDSDGNMTQLYSNPVLEEVSVNQYKI